MTTDRRFVFAFPTGSRVMPIQGLYTETIKSSYISSFDPATNTFTPVMPLTNCANSRADCMARRLHTATLVDNRFMLVFGGCPFYHGFPYENFQGLNYSCFTNDLHVRESMKFRFLLDTPLTRSVIL